MRKVLLLPLWDTLILLNLTFWHNLAERRLRSPWVDPA